MKTLSEYIKLANNKHLNISWVLNLPDSGQNGYYGINQA